MFGLFGGGGGNNNNGAPSAAGGNAGDASGAAGASGGEQPYSGTGFDPTGLERAAKAARELDNSRNAKAAAQIARDQEKTKQADYAARVAEYESQKAAYDVQRVQREGEERRKTLEAQTHQSKVQAQYKDQLDRKRYAEQLQAQRAMKDEELKKQEAMMQRQEAARRKAAEYEAELRQRTEIARAKAEAEGRIKQERENHDLMLERAREEGLVYRETLLQSIRLATETVGSGISSFLKDPDRMLGAAGTLSLIALGVYGARAGTGVAARYVEAQLGKPSLVRETSRQTLGTALRHPVQAVRRAFFTKAEGALDGVVLKPSLEQRLRSLAVSTANTTKNKAVYQNVLLSGPPGTGKTLFARKLAAHSGMDYAVMTGADVAPLGTDATTELHRLFEWARTSRNGLLLFIDEADAFLQSRASAQMTESMRTALNAFLYNTGTESDKFMLVLASNQPEQFDWAINDRLDEIVAFGNPGEPERKQMLLMYFDSFVRNPARRRAKPIAIADDVPEDMLDTVAARTEGFSGREIAKLCNAWAAAAHGSAHSNLNYEMIEQVLENHIVAHESKAGWLSVQE